MKIVVHYNNITEPKAYVFTDEEENEAKEKLVYIYRKKLLEHLNDNRSSFIDGEKNMLSLTEEKMLMNYF